MRKARVSRPLGSGLWQVRVTEVPYVGLGSIVCIGWASTHAEALSLARLLVAPHEYIRQAQEKEWEEGKAAVTHDRQEWITHGESITTLNPYRKEDQ